MIKEVLKYFYDNPNPSDAQFHEWTEEQGVDTHEAETAAYVLATKFAKFWLGGKYAASNLRLADVDDAALQQGIEVEQEHVDDRLVAQKIALDHLAEDKEYYTKLKEMEGK